jgi:hypothetical protein
VLSAQPNPSCRTHPTSRRCRWLRQDLPHRNPRWHRRPLHGRPRLHAHRTRRRRSAPRSQDRSRARETLVARDPLDARSTSHRPLEPLPLFNQSRARPWAPAAFTIMRQKAARCASPLSSKALVRALAFTSLLSQPHAAGRASRNECARREGGKGPPLREEERAAARDEVRDGSRGAGVVLHALTEDGMRIAVIAQMLDVHVPTVTKLVARDGLPAHRLGSGTAGKSRSTPAPTSGSLSESRDSAGARCEKARIGRTEIRIDHARELPRGLDRGAEASRPSDRQR